MSEKANSQTDSQNVKGVFRGAVEISPKYFDELIKSIEQAKTENAEYGAARSLKLEFPQGLTTTVQVVLTDGTRACGGVRVTKG